MSISIRHKFIIGFLIIFCIGYNATSFFINKLIVQNNKKIIKKELLTFEKDLAIYLKQYFELKQEKIEVSNFNNNGKDIASKLSVKIDSRVITYNYDGKFLADSANSNGQVLNYVDMNKKEKNYNDNDLELATTGKSAFTILPVKDKYIVVFSCPIVEDAKIIGIVRCVLDYSEIFSSNQELLKLINTSILIVFGGIFTFVVLLSSQMTIPIVSLSKISKEVAKGNFELDINIKSNDEIGELSLNFNRMKAQIKKQIETIKKDRDNLKKAERHREVFFDNVTHEMKTPLTIISGYAQLIIKKDFKDKEFSRKSIRRINDESERMHKMVLQLLQISKLESEIESNKKEEVNISKIIDIACNDMKIRADKYDICIEKNIEEDIILQGNSNELRRVVVNLIDNSIKYGNIKSAIKISLFKENDNCNILIEDRGKGIPNKNLDKIFEPFYRVDKENSRDIGSSGLGLSIVKKIINKHQGKIEIVSEEMIGTKVYIKIPLKSLQDCNM